MIHYSHGIITFITNTIQSYVRHWLEHSADRIYFRVEMAQNALAGSNYRQFYQHCFPIVVFAADDEYASLLHAAKGALYKYPNMVFVPDGNLACVEPLAFNGGCRTFQWVPSILKKFDAGAWKYRLIDTGLCVFD